MACGAADCQVRIVSASSIVSLELCKSILDCQVSTRVGLSVGFRQDVVRQCVVGSSLSQLLLEVCVGSIVDIIITPFNAVIDSKTANFIV